VDGAIGRTLQIGCNDAGGEIRSESHDGFALHATPQNDFAGVFKPDDAAAILPEINAGNRDMHG